MSISGGHSAMLCMFKKCPLYPVLTLQGCGLYSTDSKAMLRLQSKLIVTIKNEIIIMS